MVVGAGTTTTTPTTTRPKIHVPHLIDPRVYIRDVITVDAAFQERLLAISKTFDKGTTLTVAARRITHSGQTMLKLPDYPLVFIADEYDGKGGGITTTPADRGAAAAGATGTKGVATATSSKPGGTGKNGQPGLIGETAAPVTIIAQSVRNLKVVTDGGRGGNGGAGGKGGAGAPGLQTPKVWIPGTSGGSGADGGNAGPGAAAGLITVVTTAPPTSVTLSAKGGAPGAPGSGGSIGAPPMNPAMKKGKAGKPATAGPNVAPQQSIVAPDAWWAQARGRLGSSAWTWADHRTRVGRYGWRVKHDTTAALKEFGAAVALYPHAEAKRLGESINAGLTPVGIGLDHDLRPDFAVFADAVTDYAAVVLQLALTGSNLLLQATSFQHDKSALIGQLTHIRRLEQVHENGIASAQTGIASVELEVGLNAKQLQTVQDDIEEVKREMKPEHDPWEEFLGIATAFVAIVGAAYTGGATLAALPASVGLITDSLKVLESNVWNKAKGEYDFNGKSISAWKDSKEYKDMAGGLKELAENAKTFYDNVTIIAELGKEQVDSELAQRQKELVRRLAELEYQRRLLTLKRLQADLALDTAKQIQQVAQEDARAIEALQTTTQGDIEFLADLATRLMRSAQVHLDLHTKYVFYAARALDLYTLTDTHASKVNFGIGYVHPDVEAEALFFVGTGSTEQFTKLLGDYHISVANFAQLQPLSDEWITYDESLSMVSGQIWDFTDQATLDLLRTRHEVELRVPVSSIPTSRTELKVTQVYVSLVGAKGKNATVLVEVEHSGSAENRTRNGKVKLLSAPARRSFVSATTDESVGSAIQAQPFWGRSPAALWRLRIDPAEFVATAGKQLDLTGLTEIQLTMNYKYLQAAGT